jgi:hypothetical protein
MQNNNLKHENPTDANNMLVTGLTKDKNHDHYWIDDDVLYESYRTIRGLRYRPVLEVFGMANCEKCSPEMIMQIEKQYIS